jgi:hypothetical protein
MKNTIIISGLVTLAFFGACCKRNIVTDPCTFSSEFVDIVIPFTEKGATVISPFVNLLPTGFFIDSVFGQNVPSTVEAQVNNNGQFKTCQTGSIVISQLRVTIDSPANQNFSFIDSICLYLKNKDGSGKILVGSKGSIPTTAKDIIMNIVPNLDIKNYVIKDSFGFVIGVTKSANAVPNTTDSTHLKFDASFKAKVFTK